MNFLPGRFSSFRGGNTPLHIACITKNLEMVKCLKESGADINRITIKGKSPLIISTEKESLEIVKYLLEHEADANIRDNEGKTPLLISTEKGSSEIVKYLLEQKANVNIIDSHGNSALSIAVLTKNVDIAKALLDAGADVNQKRYNRSQNINHQREQPSVLSVAIDSENTEMAKMLTERGADVNKSYGPQVNTTVLMLAADNLDEEWVKDIISKGANLDEVDGYGNTTLMRLLKKITASELKNETHFKSPEEKANYIKLIELLISRGSDPKKGNKDGTTALHLAAICGPVIILTRMIDKILSEPPKEKPNVSSNEKSPLDVLDNLGATPLHHAVRFQKIQNVRLLIKEGASVDVKSKDSDQ